MKIHQQEATLCVSDIRELGAANAHIIRDVIISAFGPGQRNVEIDLSETCFLDSCGLGALIALHKHAAGRSGTLRVVKATEPVHQLLELTRMDRLFTITASGRKQDITAVPEKAKP